MRPINSMPRLAVAGLAMVMMLSCFDRLGAEPIRQNLRLGGETYKTYRTESFEKCQDLCSQTSECTGLNFEKRSNSENCELLTGDLKEDNRKAKGVVSC